MCLFIFMIKNEGEEDLIFSDEKPGELVYIYTN